MKSSYLAGGLAVGALALAGCTDMSEYVGDASAGLNGSFETYESGLPVNWIVYTPNTVPDGDFEVALVSGETKDGSHSLRFDVRACAATGGWKSPGMAVELNVLEPGTLWVDDVRITATEAIAD